MSRPVLSSLRTAVSLFTVFPASGHLDLDRRAATRAIRWLPLVGLVLAVLPSGVLLAVHWRGDGTAYRLLGSTLAIGLVGLLTGGLHLDGLADTADGLGSRRPPEQALAVMRQPDVGPMGVATLGLVVLVQVTALAVLPPVATSVAGLALALVVGRVAALLGTTTGMPGARRDGFGAPFAGVTSRPVAAAVTATVLAGAGAGGLLVAGPWGALKFAAAAVAGLAVAHVLARHAVRRLGGITGDVLGALVETTTAATLLTLALTA